VESLLAQSARSRELYASIRREVERLGESTVTATTSQVGFRRRHSFAAVWMPGQYLRGKTAPLVLTVYLPWRDDSPRWKQIVEPAPGRFTHHLELNATDDIDDDVRRWLRQAWEAAQ
jgi:hypothetical protein